VAGIVQALGYAVYLYLTLRGKIKPEPTTWFMFAYGTVVIAFLEWQAGASFLLLFQPIVCAALGVLTAFIVWRQGRRQWPEDRFDQFAFLADVTLTIIYAFSKLMALFRHVPEHTLDLLVLIFLVCSNASGVVSFIPILRNTRHHPFEEHLVPWIIWGISYFILAVYTYFANGLWSIFMLYAALNTVLHLSVAVLAVIGQHRPLKKAPLIM
jgi:hypothetical protein